MLEFSTGTQGSSIQRCRVIERGNPARFCSKRRSLRDCKSRRRPREETLIANLAPQTRVTGPIDFAASPDADAGDDFIGPRRAPVACRAKCDAIIWARIFILLGATCAALTKNYAAGLISHRRIRRLRQVPGTA